MGERDAGGVGRRLSDGVLERVLSYVAGDDALEGLSISGRGALEDERARHLAAVARRRDVRASIDLEADSIRWVDPALVSDFAQVRVRVEAGTAMEYLAAVRSIIEGAAELRKTANRALTVFSNISGSWLSCLDDVVTMCRAQGVYLTLLMVDAKREALGADEFWEVGRRLDAVVRSNLDVVGAEHPAWGLRFPALAGECPGLTTTLHVHHDDSSRICAFDEQARVSLTEHTLEEAWDLMPAAVPPKCRACRAFEGCGGGCVASGVCYE